MAKKPSKPTPPASNSGRTHSASRSTMSRREQLREQQRKEQEAKRRRRVIWTVGGVVLAIIVIIGVMFAVTHASTKTTPAAGTTPNASAMGAQITPPDAKDNTGIGYPSTWKSGVPTLVIYEDYQCPICKEVDDKIGRYVQQAADQGQINLEFRTLVFLDQNLGNDSSTRAAVAAACADTVGAYKPYHDALYAHQPTTEGAGYTNQQLLVDIPAQAGITGDKLTQFQQCVNQQATLKFVQTVDSQPASGPKVTGTPTYMVNGNKLDNQKLFQVTSVDQLMSLIKAA